MEYNSKERKVTFTTIMENQKKATIFRHFKNKNYQIITIANHSETGEKLVIYQEVENKSHCCARPLEMFFSKVDRNKYPTVEQEYRFEKLN